jgi:DNA modification methylase
MKLVKYYSSSGGTVLDLCSGTGTTALACGLMNRYCYSVDNNVFQVHKQRERLVKFAEVLENHPKDKFFYVGLTNEFQ